MIKNWLTWINLGIAGLALLFILLSMGINFWRPSEIPVPEFPPEKTSLPKGAFRLEKEGYDNIGPPLMSLHFSPMTLQLPNLRNYLVYYGRNERPDASSEQSMLHFAFSGSKEIASVHPEKPLYLVYDKDQPRVKYRFSPKNAETSLWVKAIPEEKEAVINVAMKNEAGDIIRKPEQYAQFKVKEKQFSRFGGERWELGKWKVDGTLLARQRARWYGNDLFLEKHGGEEYTELFEKQRIDFGQGEETYSAFISLEDVLAWKDERWHEVKPGVDSQQYPLLVVKKVDERLMKLELWDVGGKAKVSLNLIKSTETSLPQNIQKTFKFVGARTRSQLMFEVKNERMLISPKDWLLFVDGKWIKLTSSEDIDAYVERRMVGPLFVIDGVVRDDGRQILVGTLFNSTRTDMKTIEIPLQQGAGPSGSNPKPKRKSKGKNNIPTEEGLEAEADFDEEGANIGVKKELQELKGYRQYIEKFRDKYRGRDMDPEEIRKNFPAGKWGMNLRNKKDSNNR